MTERENAEKHYHWSHLAENLLPFYFKYTLLLFQTQKSVWNSAVKRSRPKVKLLSKRKERTQGQCSPSFFVKAEKAEAEKISLEKWQCLCTWQVDFLCCHKSGSVRACHFPRSGFQRLCSSSISRLEPVSLSLPLTVHYLNKQAGRGGGDWLLLIRPRRLYLLCFSIINALLDSPSTFSFPLTATSNSLSPPRRRSRTLERALETLQWRTIIPSTRRRGVKAGRSDRQGGAAAGGDPCTL